MAGCKIEQSRSAQCARVWCPDPNENIRREWDRVIRMISHRATAIIQAVCGKWPSTARGGVQRHEVGAIGDIYRLYVRRVAGGRQTVVTTTEHHIDRKGAGAKCREQCTCIPGTSFFFSGRQGVRRIEINANTTNVRTNGKKGVVIV